LTPNQVLGTSSPYQSFESSAGNPHIEKEDSHVFTPNGMMPNVQYAYDSDVKFIYNDIYEGTAIKIVQAKLFKIEDYYKTAMDAENKQAQNKVDHLKVLQIESMNFKLNFTK
jgi:hypothetical protein